jgi:hypothetical protein
MGSRRKNAAQKNGSVAPEMIETARLISKLKGEDFDELLACFVTDYVHKNLRVLNEKVKSEFVKEGVTNE